MGLSWLGSNPDSNQIQPLNSFYQQAFLKNPLNNLILFNQQQPTNNNTTALGQSQSQLSPNSIALLNNVNYLNSIKKINTNLDVLGFNNSTNKNPSIFSAPETNPTPSFLITNPSLTMPDVSYSSFLSNSNGQNDLANYSFPNLSLIPLLADNIHQNHNNNNMNNNTNNDHVTNNSIQIHPNNETVVLIIEGLAPNTDESIIWQLFSAFPSVLSVQILPDQNKTNVKAKITMLDSKQASLALQYFNG